MSHISMNFLVEKILHKHFRYNVKVFATIIDMRIIRQFLFGKKKITENRN